MIFTRFMLSIIIALHHSLLLSGVNNGYYYFSGDNLTKSTNQINGRKANHNEDNVQYINFGEDDQMVSYFQTMLPYF